MADESFAEAFHLRVAAIVRRAKDNRITMSALAQEAGVHRDLVRRWSAETPRTIAAVDQLEQALQRLSAD